jgi:hypothetical protein
MATTIYQLGDATGDPRVDWLEVDSGVAGGTSGKIARIFDAASATDANGNPTPDTTAFPPANYPLGTLFYATSYPAAVADGQMTFRRVGAAGSESWAWFRGSFRAANSNGDYVRTADGRQECAHLFSSTVDITMAAAGGYRSSGGATSWTFPAAFAAAPRITGTSDLVDALLLLCEGVDDSFSTEKGRPLWWRVTSASAVAVRAEFHAIGRWK